MPFADIVSRVRDASDIAKIVGSRLSLQKGGANYKGCCPFHQEKTPSFMVHPGKQTFHCFGCGESGDVFDFIAKIDNLNFGQALKQLADLAGIQLPKGDGPIKRDHRLKPATAAPMEQQENTWGNPAPLVMPAEEWRHQAAGLVHQCHKNLLGNMGAMKYLAARGIDEAAVRKYALGWNYGDGGKDLYKSREAWGMPREANEQGHAKRLWIPRGIVIPYIIKGEVVSVQIRRRSQDIKQFNPDMKYYFIPCGSNATAVFYQSRRAFVVVEARLDAIACAEAQKQAGAVAVDSLGRAPDKHVRRLLGESLQILNALDVGDKGKAKENLEKALKKWQAQFPNNYERWPVPKEKDPGDAFKSGVDLGAWIMAGLPPVFHIGEGSREYEFQGVEKRGGAVLAPAELSLPPEVNELASLLKNAPVVIVNTANEFGVRKSEEWAKNNSSKLQRINSLVFGSLWDWLERHPAQVISAENLLKGLS